METRYLNTLVAVVETGTFSKASESLHITQSAVSQRIKFLEEHFGQQLLDRSGQRLALTAAGQLVFNKATESWYVHEGAYAFNSNNWVEADADTAEEILDVLEHDPHQALAYIRTLIRRLRHTNKAVSMSAARRG